MGVEGRDGLGEGGVWWGLRAWDGLGGLESGDGMVLG